MGKEILEVKKLLARVGKEIDVERGILFGSRARGDHLVESDLDFILVSKDFQGIFVTDRPKIVYKHWKGNYSLEVVCLTPEEYEEKAKEISIIREAGREGIQIMP